MPARPSVGATIATAVVVVVLIVFALLGVIALGRLMWRAAIGW